jgi:hypothetical protein
MRVRSATAAAITTLALVALGGAPAYAGTGASQACSDHVGYQEIPVSNGIVTIGAELFASPTAPSNALIICFSNTVPGVPSTVTGGALWVFFGSDGGTSYHANLYCDDDLGPQTVDLANPPFSHCNYHNGVSITFSTISTPGGACVQTTPPTCVEIPVLTLPVPVISVTVANVTVAV